MKMYAYGQYSYIYLYHSHRVCNFISIVNTTMALVLLFRFDQDFALFESPEILGHAFDFD